MRNRLAEMRKAKGLTQQDLAQRMKVARQTIIAIEKGKFNPSVILAIKLSRFFGVQMDEVFIYEDKGEDGLL